MESPHVSRTDRTATRPHGAAFAVLAAALTLAVAAAAGWLNAEQASAPFVRRDVALVQLACASPVAWLLAAYVHRFVSLGLAATLIGMIFAPAFPAVGFVPRTATALAVTLTVALVAALIVRRGQRQTSLGGSAVAVALGAALTLLPPALFVAARCRHDLALLGELIGQARLGEARQLADGLLALGAEGECNGRPLPAVAADLARASRMLEARTAFPLPAQAPDAARLARGRDLAMLGRSDAALAVLAGMRDPALAPERDNLRGTIGEACGDWEPALCAYQGARAVLAERPPSAARSAGLRRATTGVAYCLRKLGRYADAAPAYQELLALAPTADTHFLLARFYADAQQAGQARAHARRAMALDPVRYQADGQKLIGSLATSQFGCLGVFMAEQDHFGAPPVSGSTEWPPTPD